MGCPLVPNLLRKLFLTLLNAALILGCVAVVVLVECVIWGDVGSAWYVKAVGLGFIWLIAGLAIWAFWGDIKAIWRE